MGLRRVAVRNERKFLLQEKLCLLRTKLIPEGGASGVQATTTRPKITVTADGTGVVSHAGTRLLADLADRTTLTGQLSEALDGVRAPRARHDPGRVLADLAVAIADGGEAISDIAILADQPALFGPVASDSTCWRLLEVLDAAALAAVAAARASPGGGVGAARQGHQGGV
jgi:hypothetical protein